MHTPWQNETTCWPMISVITPTCNRPDGIALLQAYIARQTVQPTQWIIGNGGDPVQVSNAIVVGDKRPPGAGNLANNILNALECATGQVICIMEDDDWYDATHIEKQLQHLQHSDATGDQTLRYYNLRSHAYRVMKNRGAALCQTAFNSDLKPQMQKAARQALKSNSYSIDAIFWQSVKQPTHNEHTVVGIKGLNGTAGLGIGHRVDGRWTKDKAMLQRWIGSDIANYRMYFDG